MQRSIPSYHSGSLFIASMTRSWRWTGIALARAIDVHASLVQDRLDRA